MLQQQGQQVVVCHKEDYIVALYRAPWSVSEYSSTPLVRVDCVLNELSWTTQVATPVCPPAVHQSVLKCFSRCIVEGLQVAVPLIAAPGVSPGRCEPINWGLHI